MGRPTQTGVPQGGEVLGRCWQYAVHEVEAEDLRTFIPRWNELGSAGWEMVSCVPLSTPRGLAGWKLGWRASWRPGTTSRVVVTFKRQIA